MYHKMLVLLDGSKLAQVVFSYAQELAGRLNLNLELLQVVDPREADQLPMRQIYIEQMARELEQKTNQIRSQNETHAKRKTVKGTVTVGYPSEEILKYVDENKVDLLMLSTHGKSGIRSWNIGSVASQVIHAAKIPLWIVPSELNEAVIMDKIPKRTIVIPLNGDKIPEEVIPHVISITKQRGAETEIALIYVDNDPVTPQTAAQLKHYKEKHEAIQKYLDRMAKKITNSGLSVKTEILFGDPANEIIGYMKDNPPQLIAMAAPRSGFSKLVYGSVTENVLQLIKKTPLLLVPR